MSFIGVKNNNKPYSVGNRNTNSVHIGNRFLPTSAPRRGMIGDEIQNPNRNPTSIINTYDSRAYNIPLGYSSKKDIKNDLSKSLERQPKNRHLLPQTKSNFI